jgi:hypothetical protein
MDASGAVRAPAVVGLPATEPASRVRSGGLSAAVDARPDGAVLPAARRADGTPVEVPPVGPPGAETRLPWLAGELGRRHPRRRHAPVLDPAVPAPAPA